MVTHIADSECPSLAGLSLCLSTVAWEEESGANSSTFCRLASRDLTVGDDRRGICIIRPGISISLVTSLNFYARNRDLGGCLKFRAWLERRRIIARCSGRIFHNAVDSAISCIINCGAWLVDRQNGEASTHLHVVQLSFPRQLSRYHQPSARSPA